jgi:hypothetical protein
MLAPGADALLGVRSSGWGIGAGGRAEKDRHELVHPRIREEQVGGIGQQARRADDGMLLAAEKIKEGGADLCGSHCGGKDEGKIKKRRGVAVRTPDKMSE